MYNLIVGAMDGTLGAERLLEVVEDDLGVVVGSTSTPNIGRLLTLPTLLMPEVGDTASDQVAQIGTITNLTRTGRLYQFNFVRDPAVPVIPSQDITTAARALHIGDWDLQRTRWSVKSSDLYRVLVDENLLGIPKPTVFKLAPSRPEPGRVAVMMPFAAPFDSVWETIKTTAAEGGWLCQRADDIWEDSVVINDIVSLISRSEVVVCDFTDRNANVLYEAGIAHTLGREVIPITQRLEDIPFDVSRNRYINYVRNSEGLSQLRVALRSRLETLLRR